jgi:hypothetical protein
MKDHGFHHIPNMIYCFFGGVFQIYVGLKEGIWRFPKCGVRLEPMYLFISSEWGWILPWSMNNFVARPDPGLLDMCFETPWVSSPRVKHK